MKDEPDATISQICEVFVFQPRHRMALNEHLSFGRLVERTKQVEECGFACAARACDRHSLPTRQPQIESVEDHEFGSVPAHESLGQPPRLERQGRSFRCATSGHHTHLATHVESHRPAPCELL